MTNRVFKIPPVHVQPIENNRVSTQWKQWYDDIHRELAHSDDQTVTSAGALDVDAKYVDMSITTGTYAVTLAAPTRTGLFKLIELTSTGGGTVTMSLSNCVGGSASTTCTWNSDRDSLLLISQRDKWLIFKENGVTLT